MIPAFALSLSSERIALLRRQSNGWAVLGDMDLTEDDLSLGMQNLHDLLTKNQSGAAQVALILPNDQIKYLTTEISDQDDIDALAAARHAMDRATPYAIDELALDWSIDAQSDGKALHVAAVARDTLDEAEGFAAQFGFDPVSFVAIAPKGEFSGCPMFGAAKRWTGARPDRFAQAISIVEADDPEHPLGATDGESGASQSAPDTTSPGFADARAHFDGADAQPDTEETNNASVAVKAPTLIGPAEPLSTVDLSPARRVGAARIAPPAISFPKEGHEPVGDSDTASGAKTSAGRAKINLHDAQITSSKLLIDPDGTQSDSDTPPKADMSSPAADPDTAAAQDMFARLEQKSGPETPDSSRKNLAPVKTATDKKPHIPHSGATDKVASDLSVKEQERLRLTVFGERQKDQQKSRNMLRLVVVSLFVVFLAVAAALAAFYPQSQLVDYFGFEGTAQTPPDAALSTAPATAIEETSTPPAPEADNDVLLTSSDDDILPVLDEEAFSDLGLNDPPALPQISPSMTADEAQRAYVSSGIWQLGPDLPKQPSAGEPAEFYRAAIDPTIQGSDPILLPAPDGFGSEPILRALRNPPAAGEVFLFDDRGLVRATPSGTLTPQGIRIFSGRPPATPPLRQSEPVSDQNTARPIILSAADQALAKIKAETRPRLRPSDLAERLERATLGGATLSELAALRPVLRPKSAQEIAQEQAIASNPLEEPSLLATNTSLEPVKRPAKLEARAQELASATATQSSTTSSGVAVARADRVQPTATSGATVTRQATVTNTLNLNTINLIGVFGTPSARRAMVRLPSANIRQVKVGDRLDGGRVTAIGDNELRYVKGGRNIVLQMPRG